MCLYYIYVVHMHTYIYVYVYTYIYIHICTDKDFSHRNFLESPYLVWEDIDFHPVTAGSQQTCLSGRLSKSHTMS